MGRRALVLVGLLLWSCGGNGVTIYAPPQLAEGSIFIDGKPAGRFQKTQREYRWLGWKKMKDEVTAPPRSETIAKLPPVTSGKHELRIEKSGYEPIVTTFEFTTGRREVEINDAQLKPAAAAPGAGAKR
jgi:hypothetical protein